METSRKLLSRALLILVMMDHSTATADELFAGDAVYKGRVISALGAAVTFDFDCSGSIKTFELKENWALRISGDCGSIEPPGIGGSEICSSNKEFAALFKIVVDAPDGVSDVFDAVEYYSYDSESFYMGSDGKATKLSLKSITVRRIAGDYCAKNFGRELN